MRDHESRGENLMRCAHERPDQGEGIMGEGTYERHDR